MGTGERSGMESNITSKPKKRRSGNNERFKKKGAVRSVQ